MVLTVLEAQVSPDKWNELKKAYENLSREPPAIAPMQSYLVQCMEEVNKWRLVGVWRSREDLAAMRKQGTPRGVKLFQDLGVEPAMSIYDVVASANLAEMMPMSQH